MTINRRIKPESYRKVLDSLIDQARQNLLETVDYSASWLKEGGIGSHEWKVLGAKNEIETIDFNQPLSNMTLLTDPANTLLLESIQKQSFCLRAGYLQKTVNHEVWLKHLRAYFNIASWLCLHEAQYKPQQFCFKQMNENTCKIMTDEYSEGGWASALKFKDRLCEHFCEVTDESYDGFDLTPKQVGKIIVYLKVRNLYISSNSSESSNTGLISRVYLANILGTHPSAFQHTSIRTFLRRFETSLQGSTLSEGKTRRAKFKSQRNIVANESDTENVSKKSLKQFLILLKSLTAGQHILTDSMPSFDLNIKLQLKLAEYKIDGHTKKIPHSIGMFALEKSIEWIMVYGTGIVDATTELVQAFNDPNFITSVPARYLTEERQSIFDNVIKKYNTTPFDNLPSQSLREALNIHKFANKSLKICTHESMTFIASLECLVASCAIVIGLTKPIRANELSKILRNSLSYQTDGGGAYLTHPVLKKGVPTPPSIRRPIPYIASRAIQLLSILGSKLKVIYGDESQHSNELFYFPSTKSFKRPGGKKTSVRIDAAIRLFCDIIETPVDLHGRRWYIKVHEMRKFFIMTMHRHENIFTDDALRNHAGQSDRRHLWDYLSGEVPDEEFLQYEIESIEDKLINFELDDSRRNQSQGLAALYEYALKAMAVTSLKSKNSYEFNQFLRTLLVHKELLVCVYTIRLTTYTSEIIDTDIALRFGEAKDENYDH
ncbi:hypothetical protein [Pseudomonas fluorescens]|nr:hypothetical protein [Pseudomonas fluorescens]